MRSFAALRTTASCSGQNDRLLWSTVSEQRLQARAEVVRLEPLGRRGDLISRPPAMAARPAPLALVEAGRIGLGAVGVGKKKALLVQDIPAAPAHAALARPHP